MFASTLFGQPSGVFGQNSTLIEPETKSKVIKMPLERRQASGRVDSHHKRHLTDHFDSNSKFFGEEDDLEVGVHEVDTNYDQPGVKTPFENFMESQARVHA